MLCSHANTWQDCVVPTDTSCSLLNSDVSCDTITQAPTWVWKKIFTGNADRFDDHVLLPDAWREIRVKGSIALRSYLASNGIDYVSVPVFTLTADELASEKLSQPFRNNAHLVNKNLCSNLKFEVGHQSITEVAGYLLGGEDYRVGARRCGFSLDEVWVKIPHSPIYKP